MPDTNTTPTAAVAKTPGKAPFTRGEKAVSAALAAVLVLAGAHFVRTGIGVESRRSALRERRAAELASLSGPERNALDVVRGWIAGEAQAPKAAIRPAAGLDPILAQPTLYVRLAKPDLASPMALTEAIRGSAKDALALCLVVPPASAVDGDLAVGARHDPASPAFQVATSRMARLDTLQRGLRPFQSGWLAEVDGAEDHALRALEFEFDGRTPSDVALARGWTSARYAIAVIDEMPQGEAVQAAGSALGESFRTATLGAIEAKARDVRIAVLDLRTNRTVMRFDGHVDPPAFAGRTGATDPAAGANCGLALSAREFAAAGDVRPASL